MTPILTTDEPYADFVRRLDDLAAGCDPDFDAALDDLDREFAELRLTFGR